MRNINETNAPQKDENSSNNDSKIPFDIPDTNDNPLINDSPCFFYILKREETTSLLFNSEKMCSIFANQDKLKEFIEEVATVQKYLSIQNDPEAKRIMIDLFTMENKQQPFTQLKIFAMMLKTREILIKMSEIFNGFEKHHTFFNEIRDCRKPYIRDFLLYIQQRSNYYFNTYQNKSIFLESKYLLTLFRFWSLFKNINFENIDQTTVAYDTIQKIINDMSLQNPREKNYNICSIS